MDRRRWAGLVAGPLALAPSVARADGSDPGYSINPGALVSGVAGAHGAFAVGGELSFMTWPHGGEANNESGYGAFLQAQAYTEEVRGQTRVSGRYALGFQTGNLVGLEAGWAYRAPGPTTHWSSGPHLAIFGSLGFLGTSIRLGVPIANGSGPGVDPGVEVAFCLTVKFPIVHHLSFFNFGSQGRRLRSEGRVLAPRTSPTRDPRARRWATDGAAELASVPAFLRLRNELRALGAPSSLVARAGRAAVEELGHARACFALASRFAGEPVAPLDCPLPAPRRPSFATLAVEALVDGVIGEGSAARRAAFEARSTDDPLVAAISTRIAREEAGHAALADDVLAWSLDRGGRAAKRALDGARSALTDL